MGGLLKTTTSISSTTKNQYVTTSKDPEYCPFKKDSMDSPCNRHKCMGYYGTKSLECQMIVRSYCAKYNDVSSIEAGDDGCASFVRDDKGSISTTTKRTRTTTLSPPRTTRSSSSSTTTRKSHTGTIPGLLKTTTSISSTTKNQYVTTSKDPEYCPFKKDSMDSPCNHHKCMGYYCTKYNDVSSIEAGDDGCASFVRDDTSSISTTTK